MRMRTLTSILIACVATCAGLLGGGVAQAAGFAPLEPKCSVLTQAVAAPKLDAAFFKKPGVKVWASSGGATGVFFIEGPNAAGVTETYVVKFEEKVEAGVVASRRIFETYGVPHDRLLKEYTKPKDIKALFDAIKAKRSTVEASRLARFDGRVAFEAGLFDAGRAPKVALVTQFLPALAGAASFGEALTPPNDGSMATPQGVAKARLQFILALQALNMPHNQKLLGYLFVMDSFLGNGDRLLGPDKNLGNLFLAAGTDSTPCLVAIDNEAHAPAGSYLVAVNYADKLNSAGADPAKTQKSEKKDMKLTADMYLTAVLGRYKDGVTYKNSVGPLWAFNGDFLYGRPADPKKANDKKEALETCDPVNEVSTNSSLKMWIRRMFRAEFIGIINDMAKAIPDGSVSVLNFDYTEDGLISNAAATKYKTVCHSVIGINYKDSAGKTVSQSIKIDWLWFDQYFAEGALFATRDIGNVATMKTSIATALKGLPTKNVDVAASALEARSQFVSYVMGGEDPDTVIATMLAKHKKEAYAKDIAGSATSYVFVGDHWEPK